MALGLLRVIFRVGLGSGPAGCGPRYSSLLNQRESLRGRFEPLGISGILTMAGHFGLRMVSTATKIGCRLSPGYGLPVLSRCLFQQWRGLMQAYRPRAFRGGSWLRTSRLGLSVKQVDYELRLGASWTNRWGSWSAGRSPCVRRDQGPA